MEITDKKKNRVFVLSCGRSCDTVDYLEFLRNEYVIALSRWCFYEEYKFDFYFINDSGLLIKLATKYGGLEQLKTFCGGNSAKWFRDAKYDSMVEKKYNVQFGDNTYRTHELIPCRTPSNTKLWQLNDEEFLNENGTMPVGNPFDYFSHQNFSKYKIKGTGCGTVTRCAIDLAYFLRFKTCYVMNVDVCPFDGASYSKYIMKYAIRPDRKTNSYKRNGFFDVKTWRHRYAQYKGMNIRRVVPECVFSYELSESKASKTIAKKLGMFKNVLYENLIQGITDYETSVVYNNYVI